ncbi:hypothetical protein GW17_00054978 [Ensete ventricosum]|nr:hypothetical protein GW17_00054978 [Ensete ventricosum]
MTEARFAISTCIARYGGYIPVRQVTGTRTARYRAVPSKIDRRRSIEEEKGKKKRKRKKKKRGRKNTSPAPSSPACRRRPWVACARSLFLPREETDRGDGCILRLKGCPKDVLGGDSKLVGFRWVKEKKKDKGALADFSLKKFQQ